MNMFNKFGLGAKKQQTLPLKGEKLKKRGRGLQPQEKSLHPLDYFWGFHSHFYSIPSTQ